MRLRSSRVWTAVGRLPRALWVCIAIGVVNAALWAVITPPFWSPDEPVHVGYVQWLAETGKVPRGRIPYFVASKEEAVAFLGVPWSLEGRPSWSPRDERMVRAQLTRSLDRRSEAGAGYAAGNPPLFYALDAIPYRLAASADFFDRLLVMRLLSSVFAGLTVGFVFLFLREVLPATPWAWRIGALAVAFQPMLGFLGGAVTNDCLLFAISACLFYLVARGFRRGLTPGLGAAIGVTVGLGVLTKTSMLAFLPAIALAMVVMGLRSKPQRRAAAIGVLAAAGVATLLIGGWLVASHVLLHRSGATTTGGLGGLSPAGERTSLSGQLSYLWQYFLPRLPSMSDRFPGYPLWGVYFRGFVGRFGWSEFGFPVWASGLALGIVAVVGAFAAAALVRCRAALRLRWVEALVYGLMAAGLFAFVGIAGYRYRAVTGTPFEQTRYLFPLLALYGGLIALAARGAGRRWGPAAGVVLVVLAMGHSLFGMLLSLERFYT